LKNPRERERGGEKGGGGGCAQLAMIKNRRRETHFGTKRVQETGRDIGRGLDTVESTVLQKEREQKY